MAAFTKIVLVVLAISFMTFVAFFGRLPALRHTPIAWLHRAIWVYVPNAVLAVDQRLTSGRLSTSLGRFGRYIMYDRHPTVLIFFVLLLSVGEYMYLPGVWPRLSLIHKVLGSISIILPYLFLYLAAAGDPGVVTPATHSRFMSHYPYDFSLFHPGSLCRTCGLLKPPRSKHCSVCKRCVHKMDHHCVFINNCVGYGNQHYFILLLLSTATLTLYGGLLGLVAVADTARNHNKNFSLFPKPHTWSWSQYFIALTMGIQDDVGVGSVTLLALMTSPLVWGLLAYHIYLIYCGTTTNESMKWQDWQMEMDDGCAFKRALPGDRVKDLRHEAAWTRWPLEPMQILIRTEDGAPPDVQHAPGVGEWERVWRLRDIENLYDLGFWDNLVDVFVPNYPFQRAEVSGSMADLERGKRRAKKPPKAPRASSLVAAAT
ncbi:zf-DHHC-domain-containing protein [Annulohypoxylon maeteangense]|uniref:zf-DHHC-domain-containing protein n=1 Tax=Annulohypoxylon maeteangense TaxID=1927788 RepID=UPI002008B863|nr:zf-DHHC-domain-containing protein [Annulohypoxylon maeteangense]KAI0887785.1 zf-DHHC-domain-containing protein [Annulohypoxylon maeteangense]